MAAQPDCSETGDIASATTGVTAKPITGPIQQLQRAAAALASDPQFRAVKASPIYRSAPMTLDGESQPDYANAVIRAETRLSPAALLRRLQQQENQQGRARISRWGARTLDLDILLYGEQIINQADLQIPHYGLSERLFVLQPLADLEPFLPIPGRATVAALLASYQQSHSGTLQQSDEALI